MTPEQEAMFRLQDDPSYRPPMPGQGGVPIPADAVMAEDGIEAAVQGGMGMAWKWMAKNGPIRPVTSRQPTMITKVQLEEQKMREAEGLPSNETEAARVVALEQKMDQMMGMMNSILQAREPVGPLATGRGLTPIPSTGPPPTPPERPDGVPAGQLQYHPPLATTPSFPTSGQAAPPTVLPEEPVREEVMIDGPITAEELTEPVMTQEPVPDPLLAKTQALVERVTQWLETKDPHRYWRQYTAGLNKNLAFNTWPPLMQARFKEQFDQLLGDSSFVSTICQHMVQFQNGHMLGEGVAAGFVVVIAGMLAFTAVGT